MRTDKITRILILYDSLMRGRKINKIGFSAEHGINERSFDRDIEDLRLFLSEIYSADELLFDREDNSYRLTGRNPITMEEPEAMIFAKLLLGSSVFRRDETEGLLQALFSTLPKSAQDSLQSKIESDVGCFKAQTNNAMLKMVWDISLCIGKILRLNCGKNAEMGINVSPISVYFKNSQFYLKAYALDEKPVQIREYNVDDIVSFEMVGIFHKKKLNSKEDKNNG